MDNEPEIQEFVAGVVLNALGSLSDGMTVTAVVASPLSGGASLALVPATVSVSNVCHAAGTALMAHATFSMARNALNSNNDDQGQSEGQKSSIPPDETEMSVDEALDAAEEFLGEGYREDLGGFISKKGTRRVRMGTSDLEGHPGGPGTRPHINFEEGYIDTKPGTNKAFFESETNHHIFIKP